MGKHDTFGHHVHVPKKQRFKAAKPNAILRQTTDAPQKPKPGTDAYNMYR
jgi:hypothetical protein